MDKVTSVTRLKASLSAYLAQVKLGEEILITERGRPIARVVPYFPDTGSQLNLKQQISSGIIKPSNGKSLSELIAETQMVQSQESVVVALLEERDER